MHFVFTSPPARNSKWMLLLKWEENVSYISRREVRNNLHPESDNMKEKIYLSLVTWNEGREEERKPNVSEKYRGGMI